MAENKNKVLLAIIVNGQPTSVEANLHAPLKTVIEKALHATGNTGQPVDNWELRDSEGAPLDPDRKIEDFGFPPDVRIFLNLKAGIGGAG